MPIVNFPSKAPARVPSVRYFTNDLYGSAMNQNAVFAVPIEVVHNGTDSVAWTASALSGTWDFASITNPDAGIKCIDATSTINGSIASFVTGSPISFNAYTTLSGRIRIEGWSPETSEVQIMCYRNGLSISKTVSISLYIDPTRFNEYQTFIIPIADLTLSGATCDEIRIETIKRTGAGAPPDYRLDGIQWSAGQGSIEFTVEPIGTEALIIKHFRIVLKDNVTSVVVDGTVPGLDCDKLLGVSTLSNGIKFEHRHDAIITSTGTFRSLKEMWMGGFTTVSTASNGTNTCIVLDYTLEDALTLHRRHSDKLTMYIQDDLSGLLELRAAAIGTAFA